MSNLFNDFSNTKGNNLQYDYNSIFAKLPQFANSDKKSVRKQMRNLFDNMQSKSKNLTQKDYKELKELVNIVALDSNQFANVLKTKYNLDINKKFATKKVIKKVIKTEAKK